MIKVHKLKPTTAFNWFNYYKPVLKVHEPQLLLQMDCVCTVIIVKCVTLQMCCASAI